jgi:hypothetical protein
MTNRMARKREEKGLNEREKEVERERRKERVRKIGGEQRGHFRKKRSREEDSK